MTNFQEKKFIDSEADAWFERNQHIILEPATPDHRVIKALVKLSLPETGVLIDLGGGSGKVASGILKIRPEWKALVIEPSDKACQAGRKVFPNVEFSEGSITQVTDMPNLVVDLIIVSGVLSWIDRTLLSQAIANIDKLLKDKGTLIISDFDPAFPRANPYRHSEGLFTFKQDYSLPFMALNTYSIVYRESELANHSSSDINDSYDTQWQTVVLKKDLIGKYYINNK